MNYNRIFNGSSQLGPRHAVPVFTSRTWTAPADGLLTVRAMGAGGGGGRSCTGGYSGAWGAKLIRINKGDSVVVSIGAGGAGGVASGPGSAGGATTVTVGGVTYTAPGGPGGIVASSPAAVPNGPSLPVDWDFGAASVKPGAVSGAPTGGAGVDILAQGGNATTSDSVAGSGGGGTGGPSNGVTGGGAMPNGRSAIGSGSGAFFDAGNGDWGISFYGGAGGSSGSSGGNGGGGGGGSNGGQAGGNGGGGSGAVTGGIGGGDGGLGGGGGSGGANNGIGGRGGNGFCFLEFFADLGV